MQCALVVEPTNKSVMVGDNAWLNCSTDLTIPVIWCKWSASGEKIVVYALDEIHQQFRSRFNVSPAREGRYDLLIRDTQLTDEGTYECQDNAGLGKSATTYLSVSGVGYQDTTGAL